MHLGARAVQLNVIGAYGDSHLIVYTVFLTERVHDRLDEVFMIHARMVLPQVAHGRPHRSDSPRLHCVLHYCTLSEVAGTRRVQELQAHLARTKELPKRVQSCGDEHGAVVVRAVLDDLVRRARHVKFRIPSAQKDMNG